MGQLWKAAQLRGEPKPVSAQRIKELEWIGMFNACGVTLQNWLRDVTIALGDGVDDYAKKAADLKHDHHGNVGCIRDVRAALLAAKKASRKNVWTQKYLSEIRNNTLAMRRARMECYRLAVTSGGVLGWD